VPHRPLYDYQLTLQNDPNELAKFRRGGDAALASMHEHGLPDELFALLLSSDPEDKTKVLLYAERELARDLTGSAYAECMQTFAEPEPEGEPEPEPEPPKPGEPDTKRAG
jgi:hypothetical protein